MHETQKQKIQQEIMSLNDMYVVEWCDEQRCFHVDNFVKSVLKNMEDYIQGRPLNFAVIGLAGSDNDAWNLVENLQAERAEHVGTVPPRDEIDDLATFADSVFELRTKDQSKDSPPYERGVEAAAADGVVLSRDTPRSEFPDRLASAARRNGLEPVTLDDGRQIIPYKRR